MGVGRWARGEESAWRGEGVAAIESAAARRRRDGGGETASATGWDQLAVHCLASTTAGDGLRGAREGPSVGEAVGSTYVGHGYGSVPPVSALRGLHQRRRAPTSPNPRGTGRRVASLPQGGAILQDIITPAWELAKGSTLKQEKYVGYKKVTIPRSMLIPKDNQGSWAIKEEEVLCNNPFGGEKIAVRIRKAAPPTG